MPIVEEVRVDSVESFLDALAPRHERWDGAPQSWAYRGHGDARWSLTASAHRRPRGPLLKADGSSAGITLAWEGSWIEELAEISHFVSVADSAGLPLPDHSFLRNALGWLHQQTTVSSLEPTDVDPVRKFVSEFGDWPPPEVLGALALAQHYGVRTRLLDWSRRAHVAAYFAALDAATRHDQSGHLAVWALRTEMAGRAFPPEPPNRLPRIEVVTPALASNPNMAAQAGYFTVDRTSTAPQGLEVTVASQAQKLKPVFRRLAEPAFWKFLLPRTEAPRMLKLLALEDIHAATLFPGYGGVARYLEESRLWPVR